MGSQGGAHQLVAVAGRPARVGGDGGFEQVADEFVHDLDSVVALPAGDGGQAGREGDEDGDGERVQRDEHGVGAGVVPAGGVGDEVGGAGGERGYWVAQRAWTSVGMGWRSKSSNRAVMSVVMGSTVATGVVEGSCFTSVEPDSSRFFNDAAPPTRR